MAEKKQQASQTLKNKLKNQRQQQNRRQHQLQARKERLKDQKPIIQHEPVVKYIPKPQPQQTVYNQVPRAIPKDFIKQQQEASKYTVQKQAPRALSKDFVNQQQAAKKSREKPAQPIRIINKQQKYADKRRRHYQIKYQQKQLEREFIDQEFNMEMMVQEQLQARSQRFESGLLPQERDILIRNRLEIQQDCDAFIERVYQHKNGRLFKCGFDFGTATQRCKFIIDPNYAGRDFVEALYPGRTRYKPYKTTVLSKFRTPMDFEQDSVNNKQVTYRIRLPDENHIQNHTLTILYSRKSINKFKQYVRSSIIWMQERTEMIDTKELMVAIYSMEEMSYRIPFPGKNMEELIKIHKNKKNIIRYIFIPMMFIIFASNITQLVQQCLIQKKENQHEFLKNYPGFNWDDSLKVCQRYNININCYEFDDKNVEIPYKLFTNYHIDNQQAKDYNILLLNDDDGNQHLIYIISVEKLLGIKIYSICNNHAIFAKDPNNNSKRKMDTHIKECQQNNGQIKKYITLEKFPKPFVQHITSNKTYRYLLAHNRESEYKATLYYITFRFQIKLLKIRSYQYPILVPTAVASTIKAKKYIKTISYDNSQQGFVEKWIDQVFIEALQIRDDNKFADDVPQRYEVHVIGFDCLKSAMTLIFKNIKSMQYKINDRPGSRSCQIHIIVKSTDNSIHLKFIDAKNYVSANIELDDFLRDIGKVELSNELI
ncbi:MAG: hypothetical protein EZS28_005230 [Streblomastix strix]|uniref:Uncharacterized protein n=1 Tax=Streblomastix strix TaxID=222440 RepID=A0A5J4WXF9_9EUKA|nr:MAG: hypothetical protein EZS28_005230 [Streblomastix strix]